ncbi:MAG: hypothetical protein V3569_02865 [Acholeplasmataceae bacterium]|nr:hypothetical protein [Acholeplasmataceae bacterium]
MNQEKEGKGKNIHAFSKNFFARFFGFERGIDITNDVEVLYRRNIVIKNIIFVSNIMYSVILFILSISVEGAPADWVVTFVAFPLTYVINKFLKKLIFLDTEDKTKQNVAMYVAAFYMFLSAILMYARLYQKEYFETGAYILIYYALVVISLYQEKKLLSSIFQILLAILTVIHFIWTYNFHALVNGQSMMDFLPIFVTLPEFADILLRTLLFILFYFVLYAIVSMGQYMQEERKKELIKRRQVQSDFTHIVGNLFSVVLSSSHVLMDQGHAHRVNHMSKKISVLYGMSYEDTQQLESFSLVHLKFPEIKMLLHEQPSQDEKSYEILREKTELGAKIAKRIQLAQKCIDLTRSALEETLNEKLIAEMNLIQPEIESQIILLSDLYLTLRDPKPYKRPLTHVMVMKLFNGELGKCFDENLMSRFTKFHEDFSELYRNI